ncbi:MAG: hypothetical protein JST75_19825 [Bacteroidetes bacterium]|nr:hypothetical protein [Bacteroidota bacterium]
MLIGMERHHWLENFLQDVIPMEEYTIVPTEINRRKLMDQNDTIYILDWDDPVLAPKERNLMLLAGALQMSGINWMKKKLFIKDMERLISTGRSLLITDTGVLLKI